MPTDKILHIIDHMGAGGAQSMLRQTIAHREQGFEYLVLREKPGHSVGESVENVHICKKASRFSWRPLQLLKKIVGESGISVVHCHLLRAQVLGLLLKRFFFPEVILIFHEHGQVMEKSFLRKCFLRCSVRYVDTYVAVSRAVATSLFAQLPEAEHHKVRIVPNFVDTAVFSPVSASWVKKQRSRLNVPENSFVIGYVGRLVQAKGIDLFVASLPLLDFPFFAIIAGNGKWHRAARRRVEASGLESKVLFLDHLRDVRDVYSVLDALLIPSRREAFCLSALEAQMMKVPIIATDRGGLGEILRFGENALKIDEVSAAGVARALEKAYRDRVHLQSIATNGPENAQKYDYDRFITCLRRLYSQLLS